MTGKAAERKRGDAGRGIATVLRWVDTSAVPAQPSPELDERIDWLRALPFIAMHLACLGVAWVGVSATALCEAATIDSTIWRPRPCTSFMPQPACSPRCGHC